MENIQHTVTGPRWVLKMALQTPSNPKDPPLILKTEMEEKEEKKKELQLAIQICLEVCG